MPKGNPEGYKRKSKGSRKSNPAFPLGSGMAERAKKANVRDQVRRQDVLDRIMSQMPNQKRKQK